MRTVRRLLSGLGGLRGRLVAAFVLVAVVSAVTATALAYREARTAILDRVQVNTATQLRGAIAELAPDLDVPPDQATLTGFADRLATRLGGDLKIAAVYDGLTGTGGRLTGTSDRLANYDRITPELRADVRDRGRLAFQRVTWQNTPWLVTGTTVTSADSGEPSGLQVYAIVSLDREEYDAQALLTAVRDGTLPVLALTAVLALLAAGAVLRPVRRLERTARQLAAGDLGARVDVRGRDELASLARTFNGMADGLQDSVAELREQEARARRFVADVSHELRTPLAAMTMVATVLDEDADTMPRDTAQAARMVSLETARLTRLVDELMEISRFDSGVAALALDVGDLGEIVRGSLAVRGWSALVSAELADGVRVSVDRRRIDVIVANLVGNALRHGAPPVRVRLVVDGAAAGDAGEVVIEVTDNGPGLPPDALAHVFDRFYKADAARTRTEGEAVGEQGSGLGMAIALENARLHGGTITVANRAEGGACFTLRLPRAGRGGQSAEGSTSPEGGA